MQLCQFHFYQKIARKKVARVNAADRQMTERKKLDTKCKPTTVWIIGYVFCVDIIRMIVFPNLFLSIMFSSV